MKILLSIYCLALILFSCSNAEKPEDKAHAFETQEEQRFFPVTDYLKGEVFNMKKNGINPLMYTTINNQTDSVWLKIEELDKAVAEFMHPVIDSLNMNKLFVEKNFFDQSINAYTFSYDPVGLLPDSMSLSRWDVYIDPGTNKVKRIYMVKEISKTKTMQLTWVHNQWCKIISIITDEAGNSKIEKEEKLFWDF